MRVHVQTAASLESVEAELTILLVAGPVDAGALSAFGDDAARLAAEAKRTGFSGGLNEAAWISATRTGAFCAVIGTGAAPRPQEFRRVAWRASKLAGDLRVGGIAVLGLGDAAAQRYMVEGLSLSGYAFDAYKTPREEKAPRYKRATLVGAIDAGAVKDGLRVSTGICYARDLSNEHPGRCTPAYLADQARALAEKHGFEIRIKEAAELEAQGFNLIMAVGRGSAVQPRLIHMIQKPAGAVTRRVALVGKGVTYDSGGYSMKPAESQKGMHLDMSGAAAVFGAAEALGAAPVDGVEVHYIIPTVENLVSGNAYKVNEIMKGYGGITVECLNTDAEGRLILGDALSYALEFKPDEIIDLATLTGACVIALGQEVAGVFCNHDGLAGRVLGAAERADEAVWRMPLVDRMEDQIKSDVADVKNVGQRWGGAITAALFLQKFVNGTPWTHIDLAGPAMTDAPWEYINKGGTGFGVATLVEFIEHK